MGDEEEEERKPPPTVFIARVDTFFGKIIAQHFGTNIPGEQSGGEAEEVILDVDFLKEHRPEGCYTVTGTWRPLPDKESLTGSSTIPPVLPAASKIVRFDNDTEIAKLIENADICVFHIFEDDGENFLLSDQANLISSAKAIALTKKLSKSLILLSSTMTWAKTKRETGDESDAIPAEKPDTEGEEEDPEGGFSEEIYKKRRPHPAYRRHLELEKDFLKYGRDSKGLLKTTVIGVGVLYGLGEDVLHWMFKDAWEGRPAVKFLGDGKAHVPMMHARDLCRVVQEVAETAPKRRYILATDGKNLRLHKIAEAISTRLGNGVTEPASVRKMSMMHAIPQTHSDLLTTDLRFAVGSIKEDMKLKFIGENGFIEALPVVLQEYRIVRNLTALKILVLGPPFSGKTQLASRLCEKYNLLYVNAEQAVEEGTKERLAIIEAAKKKTPVGEDENAEQEPEEDGPTKAELAQEFLQKIEESKEENDGKIGNNFIVQFVKEKLSSIPCQNRGYILDAYPDTLDAASKLFGTQLGFEPDEEEEIQAVEEEDVNHADILPGFVFYVDGPEELLRQRVMSRPEPPGPSTSPTTENKYNARMDEYKSLNPDNENAVVGLFDQALHPTHTLDLTRDPNTFMDITFQTAATIIGPPHNYGKSRQQKVLEKEAEEAVKQATQKEKDDLKSAEENFAMNERQHRCTKWLTQLEDVRRQKHERVMQGTTAATEYLMKNVLPAVQEGLLAAVRIRPQDPVDFLGEYLLDLKNPNKVVPPLTVDQKLERVGRG